MKDNKYRYIIKLLVDVFFGKNNIKRSRVIRVAEPRSKDFFGRKQSKRKRQKECVGRYNVKIKASAFGGCMENKTNFWQFGGEILEKKIKKINKIKSEN